MFAKLYIEALLLTLKCIFRKLDGLDEMGSYPLLLYTTIDKILHFPSWKKRLLSTVRTQKLADDNFYFVTLSQTRINQMDVHAVTCVQYIVNAYTAALTK